MTEPDYSGDVPLRRVAVRVVATVQATDRDDAADVLRLTVLRALETAPNRLRRGAAIRRDLPVLRHLRHDELSDPRDVLIVDVTPQPLMFDLPPDDVETS